MTKNALLEKEPKIRAWVDLPPHLIQAMTEKNVFFFIDVFPKYSILKVENNSTYRTTARVPARSVIRVDLLQWAVQLMGRWTGESPSPFYITTPFFARYDSEGKFLDSLPDLHEPRFAGTCTTFISSNGEEVFHLNPIHFFLFPDRIIVYPCQPLNL